jgi:uncharacterized delta-60 repeat protein
LLDFPDLSLATGIGFDSTIRTTLIDSTNGKIYIGGDFNSYKGIPSPRLIRLNIADGSIDTTFAIGTGFDNSIETIALDSSGKVYVGGAFTTYKGSTANKIIKLNTDGSIDTTFATGTGFTAGVKTITLDSSGKLYVGGSFTAYNGSGANYITKLNTDGSVDTSFVVGSGFNIAVFAITLDSSGKVYVGGVFTTYKGSAANRIIKLNTDGSVDTTFATGTGFNGSVNTITLDSANGKLYAGGVFTTYKGSSSNYITKLNTDGSVDTTFATGTGFNSGVQTITLDSSGKIYIGGEFGSYKSVSSIRLIKLNTDGSIDTTFATGNGFDSTVYAVTLDSSGKIYVGGFFTTYKDTSSPFMIRLNTDGSFDNFFVTAYGFNSIIYATALDFENKKLYIGGLFTNYKGSTANKIIRINIDGSIDTTFATGTGFGTGFYDAVYAIALDSSGKIYVGGNFTTYNGSTANYIIKLNTDGSVDTTFATGTGFNGSVNTITLDSSGKLYAGGGFTTYKGSSTNYITKLNTDGSVDTTFATGTGFNNNIRTIALDSSGKVYVGGAFTTYKGSAANRIIKLNTDGSVDTSLVTGTGFSSDVYTIILDSSSKLYVGGNFSTYNTSNSCNKLIKLNVDGSVDTSFVVGSGFDSYVLAIALDSANGKVYVGGNFTTYKSTTLSSRIIRLNTDGSVDTSFVVGSGFDNSVQSISSNFINEYIYVGGNFRSYKGIGSPFLTRIKTSLFYLLKSTDYFSTIIGNTTCKIKLPAISGTGKEYVIKSLLTSNTVTVNAYNGALIDSSSSKNLQPAEYVKTISSSTKWITDYNIPFSLPSNTGTANQLLSSSGSGASSWVSGINITSANISGLTASRAIQTDASKNLNSAGFSLPTVSGNNSQLLKSDGTGTSSWTSAIYSTTVTGTAIDASTGNSFIQNGSGTPRNINVTNLADGQTININVQGQSGDVINWNITQPAGDPALNAPKVGTTYSNTMTSVNSIYTIIRFGQNIFINSLHGFG